MAKRGRKKSMLKMDSTMPKKSNSKSSKDDKSIAASIAMGAGGVAVIASAVAAGAALMDEKMRTKITEGFTKGISAVQHNAPSMIEEGKNRYQAFAHQINTAKGKSGRKKNQLSKMTKK